MTNFQKKLLNLNIYIFYNKVVKVVVIPVFNEEKSIFNIINKVFNHCDKIIVVTILQQMEQRNFRVYQ